MGLLQRIFGQPEAATSNPHLLKALRRLATGDPVHERPAFYTALLDSNLLVPMNSGMEDAGGDTALSFLAVKYKRDSVLQPVFTDHAAMRKVYPKVQHCAAMPARGFFGFLPESTAAIALNPESAEGCIVDRHEFTLMANGTVPSAPFFCTVQGTAKLELLAGSATLPQSVMEVLQKACKELPDIEGVYLLRSRTRESLINISLALQCADKVDKDQFLALARRLWQKIDKAPDAKDDINMLSLQGEEMTRAVEKHATRVY